MPYLNLDMDYFDHPKTRRLIALLGPYADIFPLRLWKYVGKYHPSDGRLKNYTVKDIENICGWSEKPGELVEKLLQVRYLGGEVGMFFIPDWKQHQGHIIAFKKRAKIANSARWKKCYKESLRSPYGVLDGSPNPLHPIPNQSLPNHTKDQSHQDMSGTAFFSKPEIEELKPKIVEHRKCNPESLAFGVCLSELELKMRGKKIKNKIAYAVSILEKEDAA